MAKGNTANELAVLERRRQVANMRLRGFTQREIQMGLEELKLLNPDTGQPWSLGTVNSDIKAIEKLWQKECASSVDQHKARLFAELRAIYKRAWTLDDLERALKAVQQQRELLGTDAAKTIKAEMTGKDGAPLDAGTALFDLSKLSIDQLKSLEGILLALRATDTPAGPEGAREP